MALAAKYLQPMLQLTGWRLAKVCLLILQSHFPVTAYTQPKEKYSAALCGKSKLNPDLPCHQPAAYLLLLHPLRYIYENCVFTFWLSGWVWVQLFGSTLPLQTILLSLTTVSAERVSLGDFKCLLAVLSFSMNIIIWCGNRVYSSAPCQKWVHIICSGITGWKRNKP